MSQSSSWPLPFAIIEYSFGSIEQTFDVVTSNSESNSLVVAGKKSALNLLSLNFR